MTPGSRVTIRFGDGRSVEGTLTGFTPGPVGDDPPGSVAWPVACAGVITGTVHVEYTAFGREWLASQVPAFTLHDEIDYLETRRWEGPVAALFRNRPGIRFADLMDPTRN